MKMIALSDTHQIPPKITEEFDMLLLPGDVCPVWNHSLLFQEMWLSSVFASWVNGLPFRNEWSKVIMCAGNHDLCLDWDRDSDCVDKMIEATNGRLVYLEDRAYGFDIEEDGKMKEFIVYGTPICKRFGNWAFMRDNLDECYSKIPDVVDILITHDSPNINGLGVITQGKYRGTNAGNDALARAVERVKPRYLFCGHIHSGNHVLTEYNGTLMANVSIMNEDYRAVNKPLVVEYE